MIKEGMVKKLTRILKSEQIQTDRAELYSYSFDFSPHRFLPDIIVMPGDTKDVSNILKFANRENIAVVPRGGGTGCVGGALAVKGGIVMDLSRLDKIIDIDPVNLVIVAQGGVTIAKINRELRRKGFFFPMQHDGISGTISAYVACNGTGEHSKYGKIRDWIRGMEVVLPTGEIIRTGNRTPVASNPDLGHLFVGTEGILGVITEVTAGILPLPEKKVVGFVSLNSIETGGRLLTSILSKGPIADLMIYDILCIKGMRRKLAHKKAKALVIITLVGFVKEVEEKKIKISEIVRKVKPIETRWMEVGHDAVQTNPLIDLGSIKKGKRPFFIAEDVSVPISEIERCLSGIKEIERKYNILTPIMSGDIYRGVLHPLFLVDAKQPAEFKRANVAMEAIYKLVLNLGGILSGTHGIGLTRSKYIADEIGRDYLKAFDNIKSALDPKNILNPSKMGLGRTTPAMKNLLFNPLWKGTKAHRYPGLEKYRKQIILCDSCAYCNVVCPVFHKSHWHSDSPRGKIQIARALLTGELSVTQRVKEIMGKCTLCKLCDRECPKYIPISEIVKVCQDIA